MRPRDALASFVSWEFRACQNIMNVTEAYKPGHPEKGVMVVPGRVMTDRERWSGGVP